MAGDEQRRIIDGAVSPDLVVYSASGCCLCDELRDDLAPLVTELGLAVEWVLIDGDDALEERWRTSIPAGVVDGRLAFKYRLDADRLRRLVEERRARRAIRRRNVTT